jgi:mRNA interferase RelE/StbE
VATAPYRIELTPSARRDLLDLPRKAQERLGARINALAQNPRPRGFKKLKGEDNQYRIRVGDYRVIYSIFDDRLLVLVLRISDRKSVYRGL